MTRLERWLFRRIVADAVSSHDARHWGRIEWLYAEIRSAARREFYEDNNVTLNSFLRERFDAAMSGESA